LGNPGDVIATVTGSSFDGTNTSVTVSGLSVTIEAGESILFYTQGGTVIKAIVNATTSSSPIVLTAASGDQTANITSGDKVVPGSVTGLRIDMDGIEVRADEIRSSNYSAGSAGWLIEADGDAFFNDISARGSIVITGGSGVSNFSDAGNAVTWNTANDVIDGTTKRVTTTDEATGAGRAYTALDGSNYLVTAVTPGSNLGTTPGSAGLYLGNDYMGYYNGSAWKTFMDSSGNFYLGGTGGSLVWTATLHSLEITGSITAESGYIGTSASGFSINSDYFANGKTSLTDANTGVYVGTDGISLGASSVFKVTDAGVLTATSATISGSFNVSTDISIDSSGILIQSGSGNVNKIRWSDTGYIESGGGPGVMTISPSTSLAVLASGGTLFNPGNIRLVNTTAPSGQASTASIYSVSGDLYTKNGTGTGYKILTDETGTDTSFTQVEIQSPGGGDSDQWRYRTVNVTDGLITGYGTWSAWADIFVTP
jgi:hypothetical protein